MAERDNMPFVNANQKSLTPTGAKLNWGTVPMSWSKEVRSIYKAQQDNPYTCFWYQSDVEVFRALCTFHSLAIQNMTEPNAAIIKTIFERYDAFNVTIKGRVGSQLSIAEEVTEEISQETIFDLMKSIKGDTEVIKENQNG